MNFIKRAKALGILFLVKYFGNETERSPIYTAKNKITGIYLVRAKSLNIFKSAKIWETDQIAVDMNKNIL